MKRTIISILLFLFTQIVATGIVSLVILLQQIDSLTIDTILRVYNENSATILCLGLLFSHILLYLSLLILNYTHPKDIITSVPKRVLLYSVPLVITALFALNITNSMLGFTDNLQVQFQQISQKWYGFISIAITAPIIEEILFRQIIIDEIGRRSERPWLAIIVSALLFGLIHFNPAQSFFAFAAGILFGWLYVTTKSIVPSIIGHIINNTIGFIEMRYSIEGVQEDNTTLQIALLLLFTCVSIALIMVIQRYYKSEISI